MGCFALLFLFGACEWSTEERGPCHITGELLKVERACLCLPLFLSFVPSLPTAQGWQYQEVSRKSLSPLTPSLAFQSSSPRLAPPFNRPLSTPVAPRSELGSRIMPSIGYEYLSENSSLHMPKKKKNMLHGYKLRGQGERLLVARMSCVLPCCGVVVLLLGCLHSPISLLLILLLPQHSGAGPLVHSRLRLLVGRGPDLGQRLPAAWIPAGRHVDIPANG